MGQFLCTGICHRFFTYKDTILQSGIALDALDSLLQDRIDTHLFIFSEDEDLYRWELKPGLLEKETLIPFLKEFHGDYLDPGRTSDPVSSLYARLQQAGNPDEILHIARTGAFALFQTAEFHQFMTLNYRNRAKIQYENIILSMDGKIIMECYNGILRYFQNIMRYRYKNHSVSGALKVMIG